MQDLVIASDQMGGADGASLLYICLFVVCINLICAALMMIGTGIFSISVDAANTAKGGAMIAGGIFLTGLLAWLTNKYVYANICPKTD